MLRRGVVTAASGGAPYSSSLFRRQRMTHPQIVFGAASSSRSRKSSSVIGYRLLPSTVNDVEQICKRQHPSQTQIPYTRRGITRFQSTEAKDEQAVTQAANATTNTTTSSTDGLYRLLTSQEKQILIEQRELTNTARKLASEILVKHRNSSRHNNNNNNNNNHATVDPFPSTTLLQDLELDSTFAIVVTGEFNAGKSTLINALLGQKFLESGAIPTTDSITILAGTTANTTTTATTTPAAASSSSQDEKNDESSSTPIPKNFIPPTSTSSETTTRTTIPSSSVSSQPPNPPLGVVLHHIPNQPLLRDLTIIDTPGTNAPEWMDHTNRTLKLLPAADLILFVTSADRPMTESERQLMTQIQTAYRKPIVVVLNKMDILNTAGGDHGEQVKEQVLSFVTQNVSDVIVGSSSSSSGSGSGSHSSHNQHHQVMVLPVSANDALSAKLMAKKSSSGNNDGNNGNDPDESLLSSNVWQRSNFQALETFLRDSLTTKTRVQSKLSSPIGVMEGVMDTCLDVLKDQEAALQEDIATLNLLEQQWSSWKDQLDQELQLARRDMVDLLQYESQRVRVLLSPDRMAWNEFYQWTLLPSEYPIRLIHEWETTNHPSLAGRRRRPSSSSDNINSSSSLEDELLVHVQETADAVATRGRAQGQAVIEYLGTRPAKNHQSLVGSVTAASRFEDTKQVLTERWTEAVQSILGSARGNGGETTRRKAEQDGIKADQASQHHHPQRVLESLRRTAMVAATFHVGALTSGIALATTVSMQSPSLLMADPVMFSSSLLTMISCFGMGSLVHSQGTSRIDKRYSDEWSRRAQRLEESLSVIGEKELDRVQRRILQGVSPYTRFVESERERIHQSRESCERVVIATRQLRNRIKKL